jgi:hypothetical protein
MLALEKVAKLAGICGPTTDPIKVNTRRYLLGCIPIVRLDSSLWVADCNDHWRVMLSSVRHRPARSPIVGADFRKSDGAVRPWDYDSGHWKLAIPSEARAIRHRVERAIDLAYEQSKIG